jgi:hypothetical protein
VLDADLAQLCGVSTKRLNEQVKRNERRFPPDFMLRLTKEEKKELVTNCDRFQTLKHSSASPSAFTEQGVAMLSSVLNNERAIQGNIAIMRAFVRLRQLLGSHKELARKLEELERHLKDHDKQIQTIFSAIRQLMTQPESPRKKIGFHVREKHSRYMTERKRYS